MKYVKEGFYSGIIFHRVVAGFIAQAGGYTADMEPKPVTENIINESGNGLSNLRGTVALRAQQRSALRARASSTSTSPTTST